MLGNITLVYPLERLYNPTFQRNWEKTLGQVRLISPGDLEEMDSCIRKLDRYYDISGTRKMSIALGTYPDDYSNKISTLRSNLKDGISKRFRNIARVISSLTGDPGSVSDLAVERKRFDDAMVQFRLLNAFFRRWKLDTAEYRESGSGFDYTYAIKELAYNLARKRVLLLKHHVDMKKVSDYRRKLSVLDAVSEKVGSILELYKGNYLNVDGRNISWSGAESDWVPVDFLSEDSGVAPLEKFRKVPSQAEVMDLNSILGKIVELNMQSGIADENTAKVFSDYVMLKEYLTGASIASDDADERLNAGVAEQMILLHKVCDDAKNRIALKGQKEDVFHTGFAMYFAPIDKVYSMLSKGVISSEGSSLVFSVDADIRDGDVGFIFPLTKVIDGHRFYETKDGSGSELLHVLSKLGEPVNIDIRKGIFVAPKKRCVLYHQGGSVVKEGCESYFMRFFNALASSGSEWFDSARVENWLSRHCIFYDDESRLDMLGMLKDRSFVSVINRFTNKRYDNLALAQLPGALKPSEYFATHTFEDGKEYNLTLFEWERKDTSQ